LWGFLYGWTLFLVIQTGTIAAVGVAFGKFFGVFFPWISSTHWLIHLVKVPPIRIGAMTLGNMDVGINTQNLMAILMVIALSVINIFGVKTGALIQNVFTFAKVAGLLGLVIVGLFIGRNAAALAANFGANFWHGVRALHPVQVGAGGPLVLVSTLTILAVAQVGSLFSADAWNNVTFTAGEVINPKRNLPPSLALGTGVVIALYIACNVIYLNVLPLHGTCQILSAGICTEAAPDSATILKHGIQYATEDRVATAALTQMFGAIGGYLMAAAIMISGFGCNNGLILSGARVYYAMAKDGLFFHGAGKLHPKYKTPAVSLMVQMVWICILCVSGSYGQLLDYVVFAVLVFYILTIAGLFVLRFKRPNADRPYRAFGYPVLPAIYIVMAVFIDIVLLLYKPQFTWPGLIIVLLGIPIYYAWRWRRTATEASAV
jgi:APA family basic amino acid/polyamine antiporter